jgi:hypothetical protein
LSTYPKPENQLRLSAIITGQERPMYVGRIGLCLAAALLAATSAAAQPGARAPMNSDRAVSDANGVRVFKCLDERQLATKITTQDNMLVAIVDTGEGPVTLPFQPHDGGEPRITWSDGERTLVWSVGVQLMYTDEQSHLMCGNNPAMHH